MSVAIQGDQTRRAGADTNVDSRRARFSRLARLLLAVGVTGGGLAFAASASAADMLYWSNANGGSGSGSIGYANLGGGGAGTLNIGSAAMDSPRQVVLDPANGRVYWINRNGNSIAYASLSGGSGGTLTITGQTPSTANGLAIDPATGTLYWDNDGDPGSIDYVSVNGGAGQTLSTTGVLAQGPYGLALDTANGMLYWANNGGDIDDGNAIAYASISGGGGGILTLTGHTVTAPATVAVDPQTSQIFWTENDGAVYFASLSGGAVTTLDTSGCSIVDPTGLAIDPVGGHIYIAQSGAIDVANLNDTGSCAPLSAGTLSDAAFPVILDTPEETGAPTITGGSVTGSTLTCSQGSWATDLTAELDFLAPASFSYSWAENGTTIAGAGSSTLTASSAGSYTCQVSAANQAGSTAQSSAAFTVSAPVAPPVVPVPAISGLTLTPGSFRAASSGASIAAKKPPIGTTVSYSDTQAATTTFTVLRRERGYKHAGQCVTKRPAGHAKPKRCTLYAPVGSFTHVDTGGTNTFHFTGRLAGGKLKAGAYELEAVPTFSGKVGTTVTATFHIVK